jgi:hypothetical protein
VPPPRSPAPTSTPAARKRIAELRDHLHRILVDRLPGAVSLNGHPQHRLPNTLNISFAGIRGDEDAYRKAIENTGLRVDRVRANPYRFISEQAQGASATYGVRSVSLLAIKPVR